MKQYILLFGLLAMLACSHPTAYNEELADELQAMVEADQASMFAGINEENMRMMANVLEANTLRAKEILDVYGFPDYDIVGEEGAHNFWLIVQHSDHDTAFQIKYLSMMAEEVEKENASGQDYAFLIDRVRSNRGQKILYGTQLNYRENGQAYPLPTADSVLVDNRRAEMGMEPLAMYLNRATEFFYQNNTQYLIDKGVERPVLYKLHE